MFFVRVIREGIKYCTMKVHNQINNYALNNDVTLREVVKLLKKNQSM